MQQTLAAAIELVNRHKLFAYAGGPKLGKRAMSGQ